MRSTAVRAMGFAVLFAVAAMGGSLVARAQQTSAPPDVLSALLIEVRGLRAAMEHAAFAESSVQILLGRVQLQELAQDVANEQARWTELNQRLEEFERALARR